MNTLKNLLKSFFMTILVVVVALIVLVAVVVLAKVCVAHGAYVFAVVVFAAIWGVIHSDMEDSGWLE